MRVQFVVTTSSPSGGVATSCLRLAEALVEQGIDVGMTVPYLRGWTRSGAGFPVRMSHSLPGVGQPITDGAGLVSDLSATRPDVLIVGDGRSDLLSAAAKVAPTMLHHHLHWGACPDEARYWGRLDRECSVHAGQKCAVLRPLLQCSGRGRVLKRGPIDNNTAVLSLLRAGEIGSLAISKAQAEILISHGVAHRTISVLGNLGMRLTTAELSEARDAVASADFGAVLFVGRLSKSKGVKHLPEVQAGLQGVELKVYGEGYLEAWMQARVASDRPMVLNQTALAGQMQRARALTFPSRWPEPGGIVGVDAHLFGLPTAAFDLGGARDWPNAKLFARNASKQMGQWAASQSAARSTSDPYKVSMRQHKYWSLIGGRCALTLENWLRGQSIGEDGLDTVYQDLLSAEVS